MYIAPFDQQEQQIEPVAKCPGDKDRRIHPGHFEQHLVVEHIVPQTIDRADEHFCHDHDNQRQ